MLKGRVGTLERKGVFSADDLLPVFELQGEYVGEKSM